MVNAADVFTVWMATAHCTPRHYQSLNAFSVRLREAPQPDRLWWRPAGRQEWASAGLEWRPRTTRARSHTFAHTHSHVRAASAPAHPPTHIHTYTQTSARVNFDSLHHRPPASSSPLRLSRITRQPSSTCRQASKCRRSLPSPRLRRGKRRLAHRSW